MTCENSEKHLPSTVSASLDARLAPFSQARPAALDALDVSADRAASQPEERRERLSLVNDLKLLFASLGAGNGVVPLGDNSRAARLLAEYAQSLRTQ
jgi:hypothetical protein